MLERKEGRLFKDLLQTLEFYAHFEINDHTGLPLTRFEMEQKVGSCSHCFSLSCCCELTF